MKKANVKPDKIKGEMIAQLMRDIDGYNIQIQRILGAKVYAEALLKKLMNPKKENKDAISQSGKNDPS